MKTIALFVPFDLFGSAGTSEGVKALADAFNEMLADNEDETLPTRAHAYKDFVTMEEIPFDTLADYEKWREQGREEARTYLRQKDFLIWVAGNHLATLPVYEELGQDALVIQFDAHLDIYNLSDCTEELSHGNFLLHAEEKLPKIINVGNRELLLLPDYVKEHYRATYSAAELAIDPEPALEAIRKATKTAKRVFLDIDCDVFDPAFFPAISHPLPMGLSPQLLLRFIDAAWSERLAGLALSEFDPGRDRNDQSLGTLVWLLEYVLLKRYEA